MAVTKRASTPSGVKTLSLKNARVINERYAKKLGDNTLVYRKILEKNVHFVPYSKAVILKLLTNKDFYTPLEPTEIETIFEAVDKKIKTLYPKETSIDITKDFTDIGSSINNNKVQRLLGKTAIGIYSGENLVGILTSSYHTASSEVVKVIQDTIGRGYSLAVGHVVGEVIEQKSSLLKETLYIKGNRSFRSPLSLKLTIIQKIFSIADLVEAKDYDSLIKYYFNPEGSAYIPNEHFIDLYTILKENTESMSKLKSFSDIISGKERAGKTRIIQGFNEFRTTYFKAFKSMLIPNTGELSSAAVTSAIVKGINVMAEKHQEYYNSVVDKSYITKEFTEYLAKLSVIIVLPQLEGFNSGELASFEKAASKEALSNFNGSPSIKSYIEELVVATLEGNKLAPFKNKTKYPIDNIKVKKPIPARTPKVSSIQIKNSTPKTISVPKLRAPSGQFTSLTKLETLMNGMLRQTIIKNMQRPNLRNQTGRFASSVELKSLSRQRDGAITAFLTYMRYPYATFEKGGKQGNKGYYPSRLIDQSVREIAKALVTERMRVVVQ